MNYHPAYPTSRQLRREADAEAVIADDIVTLNRAWNIISQARLALAQLPELEYPDRSFDMKDIRAAFSDAITDVSEEAKRLQNAPLVLVDDSMDYEERA